MGNDLKKIVWLTSYPKSGNTWFRVFLDNALAPPRTIKGINQLVKSTMASSRFLIDHLSGVSSSELTIDETEELRPKVYRKLAEQTDDLLFLKVHDAWKRTQSGDPIFPEEITKAVIYFIRNPLDVAVSFAHHSSKRIDSTIADMNNSSFSFCNNPMKKDHQVKQYMSDWSSHVTSWIDDSGLPIYIIRYEDMLIDTFTTFQKTLNFLDIHIHEVKIQQAIEVSNFDNLQGMEAMEGFKEKPMNQKSFFREGKSGVWRNSLNRSQIDALVHKHHIQMKRFTYLPNYQEI